MLLIAIELPLITMVLSRLPDPKLSLACFGGVVYPLGLLIESPVFMFTSASTAMSKDWPSFLMLRRFANIICAALTLLHAALVFTPLYGLVVEGLLGATPEVAALSRFGLMAALVWPWAVGYRRLLQGALIRQGLSKVVGKGTVIRLSVVCACLLLGYLGEVCSGLVLAPAALSIAVLVEALYIHLCMAALAYPSMKAHAAVEPALSLPGIGRFYLPLALTSVLGILVLPIGTAAMFRMPQTVDSLAVWPVLSSLIFIFRSLGVAYSEVVIALVEEPGMYATVKKFTWLLGGSATVILLLVTITPLAPFWFEVVTAVSSDLSLLAQRGLWFGLPMPFLTTCSNWLQGLLVAGKRTRAVSEGMLLFLTSLTLMLWAGVRWSGITGLFFYQGAICVAVLLQCLWMRRRGLEAEAALRRDCSSSRAI